VRCHDRTCHRRLRELERSGAIRGYRAIILTAYQELRNQRLAALPGVQRLTSTIVMKRVVDDRPYPTLPPADAKPWLGRPRRPAGSG